MGDLSGEVLFEHLLQRSHVLESLALTLEQMLAGSYISKNTADKIMKEASCQYRRLLQSSKSNYPSHYIVGHLQQYKQSGTEWTFSVANPVISLCVNNTHPGVATIDNRFAAGGDMRLKSDMPLNTFSVAFCHTGYVMIKAVIKRDESSS
ncbi:hypothetical protein X943_001011 [Babesia divergens]|uniref:Uncharacterized protein n=1 Tax=Babesia divergens TaxID=32595 RepID=A0AAD9G6N9_BABDI|nr:hypothetical protein X943_001011 [Babesia divergens]